MYNLLTERLIRVRYFGSGDCKVSLPEILANLTRNQIESFIGLAPHQEHAWHAFLVQLAAIALNRAGLNDPPEDAEEWAGLLRNLAPGFIDDEPWSLVVEALSQPAFMQPAVPEKDIDKWNINKTPDSIDILVTAKNHDLKIERLREPEPDLWLYALINLQTMSGYPGAKNYQIIRLNGGYGNRPGVSLTTGIYPGDRFNRDLGILIKKRSQLLKDYPQYVDQKGKDLIWLESWDGKTSLPLSGLDPYFIEICRRIRLQNREGRIIARTTGSESQRIAGKDLKGNTGDPWTPIRLKDAAALSVGARGFHYSLLRQLIFEADFKPGICQRINDGDSGEMEFFAQAMTRGQGKTEGFHQRRLTLTKKVRSMLQLESGRDRLAEVSEKMVEDAGEVQQSVLKPALLALLQGSPEKINYKDGRAKSWLSEFDRRVDAVFFPGLWKAVDIDDDDQRNYLWQKRLAEVGRNILREAEQSLPVPDGRRYRALAAAERIFEGSIRNKFHLLKKKGEAA